jgi:YaiO family outer membrane protein
VAAVVLLALIVFPAASIARADQPGIEMTAPGSRELRFQSARDAAQAGDFERAINEYEKLILEEPNNVDYVFGYAQALFWSDDIVRSLRSLGQARKLAPDYEDIWKLEYRALKRQARNQSRASIDEFRQMAVERFPNAEWHRKAENPVSRKYRWEFSASREQLDNGAPDWQQVNAFFGRNLTDKALGTLSAGTFNRFGTTDTQFGAGASLDVGENWTVSGGLAVSSSPNFLPETETDLSLSRRFEHGWVGGIRSRRRDYEDASVNSFGLISERYFGKYRIAYSLDRASLSAEQAVVHALAVNFYADSGSRLGVILAAGEEVEIVGPGQLLRTDVSSIAITGRHPINEYLGFGWRLATHRQGQFYRRSAIGISVSGGF